MSEKLHELNGAGAEAHLPTTAGIAADSSQSSVTSDGAPVGDLAKDKTAGALSTRALTGAEQEWLEKLAFMFLTSEGRLAKSAVPFAIREVGTRRGWLVAGRWDAHFVAGGALKDLIGAPKGWQLEHGTAELRSELPQTILHSMALGHLQQAKRLRAIGETGLAEMEEQAARRIQDEATQLANH